MTGLILYLTKFSWNFCISFSVNSLAFHPRGLEENICTVSQPNSSALTTALSIPPAIDVCTPNLIISPS